MTNHSPISDDPELILEIEDQIKEVNELTNLKKIHTITGVVIMQKELEKTPDPQYNHFIKP